MKIPIVIFLLKSSSTQKEIFSGHNTLNMNWFGKKKEATPSTVSATSTRPVTDPQSTIIKLRENIQAQEKR
jgi:hypothetical protein